MTHKIILEWLDILNCSPSFSHKDSMTINIRDYNIDNIANIKIKYNLPGTNSILDNSHNKFSYNTRTKLLNIIHYNIGDSSRSNLIDFVEIEYYSVAKDRDTKLTELGI